MSLFLSLLLIPIAKPQAPQWDLNQKVTYMTVAKSAKKVFEDLEKITNVPLETVRDTAAETLVVDVKDVPLKILLDKIAKTASAAWQVKPHGYTLVRPQETARKEDQEETGLYAEAIRIEMDKIAQRVASQTDFDEAAARSFEEKRQEYAAEMASDPKATVRKQDALLAISPPSKLLDQLCLCLSPARLATIRRGDIVAFCTRPNRVEEPFANSPELAFGQFVREWRVWDQLAEPSTKLEKMFYNAERIGLGSGKTPDHVLLTCAQSIYRPGLELEAYVLTSQGDLLCSRSTTLPLQPALDALQKVKRTEEVLGDAAFEPASVFSPLSAKWSNKVRIRLSKNKQEYRPSDPDLLRWAADSVANDPLSLHPSDVLIGLARMRSKQLVANLPDQAMSIAWQEATKPAAGRLRYKDLINGRAGLAIESEGSWLTVAPVLPSAARRERVNRQVLRAATQALANRGYLSLDETAAFAAGTTRESVGTQFMYNVQEPFDGVSELGSIGYQYATLVFYSSLSQSQKKLLASGGHLRCGDLPMPQRSLLAQVLYSEARSCYTSRPDRKDAVICPLAFETFVNGVPSDAVISLETQTLPVAISTSSHGMTYPPSVFARELFAQERPGIFVSNPQDLELLYRIGSQQIYSFRFVFSPDFEHRVSFDCIQLDPNGQAVPFAKLPPSFMKAIQQSLEDYRQTYDEVPPTGANPPKRV